MFEAIGFLTVIAVILFLLINHITKPSPEEQKRIEIRKNEKLKEVAKEESKKTFIIQYKDLLLSLLMNGTFKTSELIDKLITTYGYSEIIANDIYREMIGYGMILSDRDNNNRLGYSLEKLKYLFPNFLKFCELSGEMKDFKDYSFSSDTPHLKKFISSKLYSESPTLDILTSHFIFGIISNNQAEREYGTNNKLFNNKFNLFLIANVGLSCEIHHSTNKTMEEIQKYVIVLNHKKILIGDILKLERDLQIQDYQYIFDKCYNELGQSESFKFIFG